MKFGGNVVSWVVVLMAASSLFLMVCLLQIDRVVNNDLYRYGLQFSYQWATPYWTMTRIAFALGWFNILAAITVQLYTMTFRRKDVEQLVTEIEKEILRRKDVGQLVTDFEKEILKTKTILTENGQESKLPEKETSVLITESGAQEKIEEKQTETEDKLSQEKTESKQPAEIVEQEGQESIRACYILRTVPRDKAFHFYEGLGKPTGEFAESLLDFGNKIMTLQSFSLVFHLKRKDIENWIKEIIGDSTLAERISNMDPNVFDLKWKLYAMIELRIIELKKMLPTRTVVHEEHSVACATLSS